MKTILIIGGSAKEMIDNTDFSGVTAKEVLLVFLAVLAFFGIVGLIIYKRHDRR